MDRDLTALERAFQLANSATCATVGDIKQKLKAEGYSVSQIEGQALMKQLKGLIKAAAARGDGGGTAS
ncbi:MAG: hypothetical protein ABL901_12290 [Hyphomicrobiaceae bacterium]